ncbi:UDP-N-acetylglucosamine 2-epimerase [Priestia megaterium]|uniref:UDP-N-acetylglucosamine 2-epimerase n=1 Tax=Priestia megaterium TaxID=1404 RepID=UPI003EE90950
MGHVEAGTLKLAGVTEEKIYALPKALLRDEKVYQEIAKAADPYGDGIASKRIADALGEHFKFKR